MIRLSDPIQTMSNISLDGVEISIIKALGFGGAPMMGSDLKTRIPGIGRSELFDILQTLSAVGFVSINRDLGSAEDVDRAMFFVNPGYAKDLQEAIDPEPQRPQKRTRRQ